MELRCSTTNSFKQVQKVNCICGFLSEAAGDPEHLHGGRDWNRGETLCCTAVETYEHLHESGDWLENSPSLSTSTCPFSLLPSPLFPQFSPHSSLPFSSLLFVLFLSPPSLSPFFPSLSLPPLLFYLFSPTSLSSLIPSSSSLSPLPLSAQLRNSTTYLRHSTLPRRQCSTQQLLSTPQVTDR